MKKIILLAFVTVSVSMASCRKSYTCTCDVNQTSARTQAGTTTTTASTTKYSIEMGEIKRKNKGYIGCDDRTIVTTSTGGSGNSAYTTVNTSEYSCELK